MQIHLGEKHVQFARIMCRLNTRGFSKLYLVVRLLPGPQDFLCLSECLSSASAEIAPFGAASPLGGPIPPLVSHCLGFLERCTEQASRSEKAGQRVRLMSGRCVVVDTGWILWDLVPGAGNGPDCQPNLDALSLSRKTMHHFPETCCQCPGSTSMLLHAVLCQRAELRALAGLHFMAG